MATSGYPGGGGICLYGVQVDGRVEAMCALRDGHDGEHRLMDRKGRWLADSIIDDILDAGARRRGAPFGVIRNLEIEPCPYLADVLAGRARGPHSDTACGWCAAEPEHARLINFASRFSPASETPTDRA